MPEISLNLTSLSILEQITSLFQYVSTYVKRFSRYIMEQKRKKNEQLQCFSFVIKKPINCKLSDFIISYLFEYLFIFMS